MLMTAALALVAGAAVVPSLAHAAAGAEMQVSIPGQPLQWVPANVDASGPAGSSVNYVRYTDASGRTRTVTANEWRRFVQNGSAILQDLSDTGQVSNANTAAGQLSREELQRWLDNGKRGRFASVRRGALSVGRKIGSKLPIKLLGRISVPLTAVMAVWEIGNIVKKQTSAQEVPVGCLGPLLEMAPFNKGDSMGFGDGGDFIAPMDGYAVVGICSGYAPYGMIVGDPDGDGPMQSGPACEGNLSGREHMGMPIYAENSSGQLGWTTFVQGGDICYGLQYIVFVPSDLEHGVPEGKATQSQPEVTAPGPRPIEAYEEGVVDAATAPPGQDPNAESFTDRVMVITEPEDAPDDPAGLVVPQCRHDTYGDCAERIRQAGGKPLRIVMPAQAFDPDVEPNRVQGTDPNAGEGIAPNQDVSVYVNPATGTDPGTDPGGGYDGPTGTPGGLFTPPDIPAINFDPLLSGVSCNVFPFGVPCWVLGIMGGFSASENVPEADFPLAFDQSLSIDLSPVQPVLDLLRPLFIIMSTVGLALWFARLTTNRGGDGDDD